MHKWSIHGNVVELSDYDYFNHWIGVIQVTNRLGGLLGGYFDIHDKNGNILEKHAKYLQENISLVEDQDFRNRLNGFEAQFQEVIALDQDAFATLSQVLGTKPPKKTRDYKALYKKLELEDNLINAHGLFSHPAFVELRQRFMKVVEERKFQKEELISYILAVFPDATRSEYLHNG